MQNKSAIIIALLLILGVGALVYSQTRGLEDATTGESVTDREGTEESGAAGGIMPNFENLTAEVVASHDSKESCWTIIDGSVYDLTSWISEHPGGEEAILQICGKDGSAAFNSQHGGSAPHEAGLANFRIGALAQ